MRSMFFFLAALTSGLVLAESESMTATATASADSQSAACEQAFSQAEEEAMDQLEAGTPTESQTVELRDRTDERLGENPDGLFECRVSGTWAVVPLPMPDDQESIDTGGGEEPSLVGLVESIEGRYQADCKAANNGAACKRQIEDQASADLLDELARDPAFNPGRIELSADGFDGSQSFNYQGKNLTLTMDGEFFFRIVEASDGTSTAKPTRPPAGTEGEIQVRDKREPEPESFTDNLDFTLYYVWDHNDGAGHDEVALSTNRWGVGLWVDNRFGFSAFRGEERAGIADQHGGVHMQSGRYDVQGIGIGYRVFDNRAVTLENMLHFVDAQYFAADLEPDCAGCTARTYEANNYYQASIKLKTNTEGLNIGWMLTWKLRDDLSNYDSLSGGWYVELQF